jgi:large subunit ribosomal protein L10
MSKALRRRMVDELVKKAGQARNFVLVDPQGLTANQAVELRRELRSSQVRMTLVKNSTAHHAFERLGLKSLQKQLTGMSALVYGDDGAVVARKLVEYAKKNKKPAIRAAVIEGQEFGARQVEELSALPARPELLSMILGAMNGVAAAFLGTLYAVPQALAGTLKAVAEKETR